MGSFNHLCRVCLEIYRGRCFFSGCPHTGQSAPMPGPQAPPSQTPTHDSVQAPQEDIEPPAPPQGITVVSPHAVIHQMATHDTVSAPEPPRPPERQTQVETQVETEEPAPTPVEEPKEPPDEPVAGPASTKVCQNCGSLSLDPEYCEHCGAEHQR